MIKKDKLKTPHDKDKPKQNETFICGFNKNLEAITSFNETKVFYVSQDKETNKYQYTLLSNEKDEGFYLFYALIFMKSYLMIKHNIDVLPLKTLKSINKITLSPKSDTLYELYIKLFISTHALYNIDTSLEIAFFDRAFVTIGETY